MADDHEGALVGRQEPHEPALGVGVQVVRGLVQQQQVRATEQDPGEFETTTFPTGKRADMEAQAVLRQPETGGDRSCFGLGLIPAGIAIGLFGACEPGHVGFSVVLLESKTGFLDTARHLHQIAGAQDVFEAGDAVVFAMLTRILAEVTQCPTPLGGAARGLRFSRQHLQGAGLAGPIATDDAHLVACPQAEGQVFDDGLPACFDLQVANLEGTHGKAPGRSTVARRCWDRDGWIRDTGGTSSSGWRVRRHGPRWSRRPCSEESALAHLPGSVATQPRMEREGRVDPREVRAGRLVWAVAFGSFLAQLVLTAPSRAWSWDEAIYLSQVTRGAEALPFVASRARGITLLIAPLSWAGVPGWTIRILLAMASSVLMALVFRVWVPRVGVAAPIGAFLFAMSWPVLFYGSEVMPNLWAALLGVGVVGYLARAIDDEDHATGAGIGVLVCAGSMALLRPPDALVLGLALSLAVLVLNRQAWRSLTYLGVGVAIGWVPWMIEMSSRFGGPLEALRSAREVSHLAGGATGAMGHLALTDGPLLGPDRGGGSPSSASSGGQVFSGWWWSPSCWNVAVSGAVRYGSR